MNLNIFTQNSIANSRSNNLQSINHFFTIPIRPVINNLNSSNNVLQTKTQEPHNEVVKKVKWGQPTWFLLHTLSVKIKESEFSNFKTELLNKIYAICINLPCPDCANHAKTYLDNINFNTIQKKEDLILLLHTFHNNVNKMKGYEYFHYDKVYEKYSLAITNNIIVNFMGHFSDRNRSIKLLATDLHRARLCSVLKQWFNENINKFET